MGSGSLYSMKETKSTKAASATKAFETILERVIAAGGEIVSDESFPLYTDIGMEDYEVGFQREVEFNLAKSDFKMIREVETHRISGAGKNKSLEERETPSVYVKLLKKPEISDEWQTVDLEDLL